MLIFPADEFSNTTGSHTSKGELYQKWLFGKFNGLIFFLNVLF